MDPLERCRQFASVTEASEDEALNWLEMTGFVLQDAVDLYFNSGGAEPAAGSASSGSRKHSYDQGFEDEENVRLPDQVKRQKLVDTDPYLGDTSSGSHHCITEANVYCLQYTVLFNTHSHPSVEANHLSVYVG